MKTRSLTAMAVIVFSAGLAGCTDGGGATPVVTVTAASPTPSPVVTPIVTPTYAFTLDQTWDLAAPDEAQGSGCTPGSGLPDGIWFGYANSWTTSDIDFDMACWWTGAEAEAQAAADGVEAYDYYITNDNTTVRVVSVASDAFGLKADVYNLSDTATWMEYTIAQIIADPFGAAPVESAPYRVWIAVNGGEVTSLAVQYVP